jgi:hypothetical protein
LIIVAARAAIGKTSNVLNLAINVAPIEKSYLDPTGVLLSNSKNKYRIVMSSSPSILGDREYSLLAAELRFSNTIFSGNSFDYKFFNLGNGIYGIRPDSVGTIDSLTGITTLQFDDKSLSTAGDIKATFDQVTGLNTD